MKGVLILGAGGTGRDILDWRAELAAAGRPLDIIGFLDDDLAKQGELVAGVKVLGPLTDLAKYPDAGVIDALGSPRSYQGRAELVRGAADKRMVTVVHPLARVSIRATLGAGAIVYPFTFVGPDTVLGRHVIVLSHGCINHDVRIGDFAILASRVALGGSVVIGPSVYVGMGAMVREGVKVGEGALIGMGAAVVADVAAGTTVVGVPARPLGSA